MGLGLATEPTLKTALCHIRALVGRMMNKPEIFGSFLSSCWVAFGGPFYLWAVLPGVPRLWRVPLGGGLLPGT